MIKRPLGALERALLLSDAYSALNVVAVVQLDAPPVPEAMAAALAELQASQAALRVRIESLGGRPHFVEMERLQLPFVVLARTDEDAWLRLAESELGRRIDSAAGPLFRCTYLFQPDRADLVCTFQHTIADAPSIARFVDRLLTCLAARPVGAAAGSELLPACETRFPAGFHGAGLALQEAGYAFRQLRDEAGYRWQARGLPEPALHPGAVSRALTAETDEELTSALVRRARRERITLNSLLNAAMLLAVHRRLYDARPRPMRTISFPSLRAFVSPAARADSLAAYFSMLRYTVWLGKTQSLWEAARNLHVQIYGSLKRGDKFVAHMMSENLIRLMTRLRSMRLAMTALSYTGVPTVRSQYGPIRVRGLHGFISNVDFGPQYTAQVSLTSGRLVWDIVYLDGDLDSSQARAIADEIQEILRSAVREPA